MGYNNISGEWENHKNRISCLEDSQSFEKLTINTLTYNDTLYYVLIKNYYAPSSSDRIVQVGDVYKYVGGGGSHIGDKLFFFTASEFEQIFHLDKEKKTIYSFKTSLPPTTKNGKSDLSKLSDYIIKSADKNNKNDFMNIRIADNGEMVRFLLPYHKEKSWRKETDIFPMCYFEMPLKDFYKWLEPVSPIAK